MGPTTSCPAPAWAAPALGTLPCSIGGMESPAPIRHGRTTPRGTPPSSPAPRVRSRSAAPKMEVQRLTFNTSTAVAGSGSNILTLTGTTPGITLGAGVTTDTISAQIAGNAGLKPLTLAQVLRSFSVASNTFLPAAPRPEARATVGRPAVRLLSISARRDALNALSVSSSTSKFQLFNNNISVASLTGAASSIVENGGSTSNSRAPASTAAPAPSLPASSRMAAGLPPSV